MDILDMLGLRNMSRGKQFLIFGGIAVVIIIVLMALTSGRKQTPTKKQVQTVTVQQGNIQQCLTATGVTGSRNIVNYTGNTALPVTAVKVKVGDNVKKGQVMLTYDVSSLSNAVQQAQASYDDAEAAYEALLHLNNAIIQMQGEYDSYPKDSTTIDARAQLLLQITSLSSQVTPQKIRQAKNAASTAKVALNQATQQYNLYKRGLAATSDGTVTQISATAGNVAPAGTIIVTQQLNSLEATLSLSPSDATGIVKGQQATVSYANNSYAGLVASVGAAAPTTPATSSTTTPSTQAGNITVVVDIIAPTTILAPNIQVTVNIVLNTVKNIMKVPLSCVKYDASSHPYVFKVVNSQAKLTSVILGVQSSTEAEVKGGLVLDDIVIINPDSSISDGMAVVTNG